MTSTSTRDDCTRIVDAEAGSCWDTSGVKVQTAKKQILKIPLVRSCVIANLAEIAASSFLAASRIRTISEAGSFWFVCLRRVVSWLALYRHYTQVRAQSVTASNVLEEARSRLR
jgi:hypothetical protein